jgi:hypothetical protein
MVLDEPKLHRRMLSLSSSLRKKATPSRAMLWSLSPPKTPLGEFAIPHHPRRVRPHRERLAVAPGRPTRVAAVAPPSSAVAAVSRPRLDWWSRLDRWYPFILIKSKPFNQSLMAQVRYWIDKISAVRFNFYGWKNVPLRDLISRVYLRFNGPR